MTEPLVFTYRNYRGEIRERRVLPQAVWYGSTGFHAEPQWLLNALDLDKDESRVFAMKDISFAATALSQAEGALAADETNRALASRIGGLERELARYEALPTRPREQPVSQPFERVPTHAGDPGFGPIPPEINVVHIDRDVPTRPREQEGAEPVAWTGVYFDPDGGVHGCYRRFTVYGPKPTHIDGYTLKTCDPLYAHPPAASFQAEWPKQIVNIPDPTYEGTRILGFRIQEGDPAWGKHGLSEPILWLERMTKAHPPASAGAEAMREAAAKAAESAKFQSYAPHDHPERIAMVIRSLPLPASSEGR